MIDKHGMINEPNGAGSRHSGGTFSSPARIVERTAEHSSEPVTAFIVGARNAERRQ
jgi:uncharacterized protein HemY